MHDLIVPEVEEPERFFPDPVFLRAPRTRVLPDGYGEFWREDQGKWERVHPICLDILRGLEAGLTFEGMVDQIPPYPAENINRRAAARLARRYVWKLHRLGYVRIDLEDPPAVFNGRYERVRELGRGGLGIAWLCRDRENGDRPMVVKHPWGVKTKIHYGQRATAIEIALLSKLHDPAFPRFIESFTIRGLLHLARDLVDGTRLASIVPTGGMKDRGERLRIAAMVARGLEAVHQAGYLFFDPAPTNFFLTSSGRLVITDVGGALPMDDAGNVRLRGIRGTAGYVGPELRTKRRDGMIATRRSDVYAFGALYYFLVTGSRPKRTWREPQILQAIQEAGVGPEDQAIIAACVHDDPDRRPADFAEVLTLLR